MINTSKFNQTTISNCPFCNTEATKTVININLPIILSACTQEELSNLISAEMLSAKFEVKACTKCGLGFNAQKLQNEILANIYSNYRYIKPQKNIGTTKYNDMIKCINKHVKKEEHIVEIGSSDGYLLDLLFDSGYSNIEGFEPSQETVLCKNKSLIRNEFFTKNSVFESKVDVFYLMHVLEHFSSPVEIIQIMQQSLAQNGKIIFEVPNYSGFHHQHLLFFSSEFVYSLAEKVEMKVLELEESESVLRVVLLNEKEHQMQKSKLTTEQNFQKAQNRTSKYLKMIEEATEFIKNNQNNKIYWWGTGSTSTIVLANIPHNMLQTLDITFIDSDETREGLVMPILGLYNNKIRTVNSEISKINKEDSLIIASSFSNEIIKTLEKASVTPKNIFKVSL